MLEGEIGSADAAAWWRRWHSTDYSWDGLRAKLFAESPNNVANLQEWWALDDRGRPRQASDLLSSGELVRAPDKRLWHIAHLPLYWSDGTPTPKATWSRNEWSKLEELIADRLRQTKASDIDRSNRVHGFDYRAQLQGCVLDRLPTRLGGDQAYHPAFDNSYFRQPIQTKALTFGPGASFRRCYFESRVSFQACLAKGQITFDGSIFQDSAVFSDARFEGEASFTDAIFATGASFESAEFTCWAFFDGCRFGGADFPQSRFLANASFHNCTFEAAEFGDTTFAKQASFEKSDFSQAHDASFWNVNFEGDAGFTQTKWPSDPDVFSSLFRNAHFKSMASFETDNFYQFAAFHGARFDGVVFVSRSSVFPNKGFQSALAAVRAAAASRPKAAPLEGGLHQLEGGLRALKLASARQGDRFLEARLHQLELTCRRMQATTPTWERVASWLYEQLAEYGNSAAKPAIALIAVWVIASLVFYGWHAALAPNTTWNDLAEATQMSASTIVKPFDVWSRPTPNALWSWQGCFLDCHGNLHSLLSRGAATLESVLSLVLLFLIALGLRRRFQIS